MKTAIVSVVFAGILLSGSFNSGYGAQIGGHYYPNKVTAGSTNLELTGVALLRYWGFKAYTGAFYIESGAAAEDALSDKAKRLELEYYRSIEGEDFGKAVNKILARNLEPEKLQRLKPKIDYHNGLYQDVKPGDRYSLTYIPGQGTQLALNGTPIDTIEGAEFAAAIFSIWLGENPISLDFKQDILGLNS